MKNRIWKYLSSIALLAMTALPAPSWAAGYTQTKYPIVMVHGFLGFDSVGPLEYFYGITSALRSGGANVYVTTVSAANSTEVRGEQLLTQVKQILAVTGAAKVNLIGHSHGGPTARYVASVRPDLVASVTSVGGVNKGSKVADVLMDNAPGASTVVLGAVANLMSLVSNNAGPDRPQDSKAAMLSLTTAGSLAFNSRHPEGVPLSACGEGAYQERGVYYFSWSGGKQITNVLDPLDAPLALTAQAFNGEKNDGLVGSCSSHLGRVIRDDYAMNHLDEINQTAGLVSLFETSPVTVFRQQANRLQGLGL
ncbi:alpha/beta fold hydrolase [Duganella sp. FT50W]|uniref:Alpha/beta fold hydrolase n=1 Tax=Duganella lactea TaxID=2692173 RepID=A0A6L8MP38_9BURK|nr:triacylglycerol lipase [Duganella lactea]MYM33879.1 alpha/beta fold hydrolase [Duganella lactea]MYM84111.1 alpha/beta fold hydrolase [Duganella lactea]